MICVQPVAQALTRGRRISKEDIAEFIKNSGLPEHEKDRLLSLTPSNYIGNAPAQAVDL